MSWWVNDCLPLLRILLISYASKSKHRCLAKWPIAAVGFASDLRRVPGTSGVAAIFTSSAADLLRQFSHGSVNGQSGLRIWPFWLPFNGLNHSQPPNECYHEFA